MSREAYPNHQISQQSPPTRYPQELRDRPQWLTHARKVPKNPRTGGNADPTNLATCGTFEQACNAVSRYGHDGIGFVFTNDDPFVGIDLDHCRDPETGVIEPWAMEIVTRFASYTEITPSGTSLHIIARGQLPPGRRRTGKIETYDDDRYFRMSGDVLPGFETIRDCGFDLAAWHGDTFPVKDPTPVRPPPRTANRLDDDAIIERAERSRNGAGFIALWNGDTSGHDGNHSVADLALMNVLRFWTQGDPEQMERLFSRSVLGQRDKWRTRADYRRRTIDRALDTPDFYDPGHAAPATPRTPAPPDRIAAPPSPTIPVADAPTCDDVRAELEAARETITRQAEQITQLQRDKSMLMALLLNPHVAAADKTAVAATLDKATRKQPGEDGLVTLKPGEIANDWRPRAKPGENTDPLNKDGSKPLMSRSAVKRTMAGLTMRKFIEATAHKRQVEPKGREPYQETVWLVKPPDSVADFLAPIALFTPAEATPRKPRTITPQCPDCGVDLDVTTWTVTETTCPECGQVHRENSKPRTVKPIITIDPNARAAERVDHLSTVRSVDPTVDHLSTCSAPPVDTEPPLDDVRPESTGPPPNWEDERRLVYGQLYRGGVAS